MRIDPGISFVVPVVVVAIALLCGWRRRRLSPVMIVWGKGRARTSVVVVPVRNDGRLELSCCKCRRVEIPEDSFKSHHHLFNPKLMRTYPVLISVTVGRHGIVDSLTTPNNR